MFDAFFFKNQSNRFFFNLQFITSTGLIFIQLEAKSFKNIAELFAQRKCNYLMSFWGWFDMVSCNVNKIVGYLTWFYYFTDNIGTNKKESYWSKAFWGIETDFWILRQKINDWCLSNYEIWSFCDVLGWTPCTSFYCQTTDLHCKHSSTSLYYLEFSLWS